MSYLSLVFCPNCGELVGFLPSLSEKTAVKSEKTAVKCVRIQIGSTIYPEIPIRQLQLGPSLYVSCPRCGVIFKAKRTEEDDEEEVV